jgi:hypothetical protein
MRLAVTLPHIELSRMLGHSIVMSDLLFIGVIQIRHVD